MSEVERTIAASSKLDDFDFMFFKVQKYTGESLATLYQSYTLKMLYDSYEYICIMEDLELEAQIEADRKARQQGG